MEVKHFTSSLFLPFMIQKESFNEQTTVAYNLEGIMNSSTWVEDPSGLCFIPDLVKIEVTFDGNINSDTFDHSKAEIFSIVATSPKFLVDGEAIGEHQNTNTLKNIMNCFGGDMIALPKELNIYKDLLDMHWSYRIALDQRIYPCVLDGNLVFECV